MKVSRFFVLSSVLFLIVFGLIFSANAALVDNGNGTITDTDTGLMWLQDMNYAKTSGYDADGLMNWDNAMTWVAQLSYSGYDDWRLPQTLVPDYSCDFEDPYIPEGWSCRSEMGIMYDVNGISQSDSGPFINIGQASPDGWNYWSETEVSTWPGRVYRYDFWQGLQQTGNKYNLERFSWAVRVVPEPLSSTLFIVGGATLGLRRFWKKFKK